MAVFLLIRHGSHDLIGRSITGRRAGVHLNAEGLRQAEALAERLAPLSPAALYCSPMERTRETAEPLARVAGLEVQVREGLNEVDFGHWSGLSMEELAKLPRWGVFNRFRSGTRIPGGEMMAEVQGRMVAEVEKMHADHPRGVVVVVSHGDPIKTVLAHYLGFPLDHLKRLEIALASVSALELKGEGARLLYSSHTPQAPVF